VEKWHKTAVKPGHEQSGHQCPRAPKKMWWRDSEEDDLSREKSSSLSRKWWREREKERVQTNYLDTPANPFGIKKKKTERGNPDCKKPGGEGVRRGGGPPFTLRKEKQLDEHVWGCKSEIEKNGAKQMMAE